MRARLPLLHFAPQHVFASLPGTVPGTLITRGFKRSTRHDDALNNPIVIERSRVVFPLRVVPQASFAITERFSKFVSLKQPGLNLFIPFIHRIVFVNRAENVYAVTHQEAITKDNASVSADGVFYFRVVDPQKAVYEVENLHDALVNLVVTNLRAVMGSMNLDDLLSGRKVINEELEKVIMPAAEAWGVHVTRVEIKEIKPEAKLVHAMDQQMIAEREKRAKITSAQATREAMINEAEGKKDAAILEATGKLEAAKLEAQARLALASAEADSLKSVSAALTPEIATFTIAKETTKAAQQLAASPNKTYVLPGQSLFSPLIAAADLLGQSLSTGAKPTIAADTKADADTSTKFKR